MPVGRVQYLHMGPMEFSEFLAVLGEDKLHHSIIDTYRDDFPKYGNRRDLNRMLNVFNFAARNAGVKVKYSNIYQEEQSATLKKDLELLCMARVVSKVIASVYGREAVADGSAL